MYKKFNNDIKCHIHIFFSSFNLATNLKRIKLEKPQQDWQIPILPEIQQYNNLD